MNYSFSRPLEGARLRVLSLGAGVQSTTLALMAARGDIGPMPDAAIFADTQAEPRHTYRHLEWLKGQLPFPVITVSAGSLRDSITRAARWSHGRFVAVPFFLEGGGLGRRQCTKEFKIEPIHAEVRELLGLKFRQRGPKHPVVEQWIGISRDEMVRMKDSRVKWIAHRWPLIEAGLDRQGCERWLRDRQYPVPAKSACTFCPYHDNKEWRRLRDEAPEDFADAIAVDAMIRERPLMKGMKEAQFVHRQLVPLGEANLGSDDSHPDLFGEDCDGICGV